MSGSRLISEEDLHAYVDGRLDLARRGEVEAYLARAPEVAERVRGYAERRAALQAALAPIADEPIPPQLDLARLYEASRVSRASSWGAPSWRAIAASILLLATGAAGGWSASSLLQPAHSGPAALAEEAAAAFVTYGSDRVRPVELRADGTAELVAWASQRLQVPVRVPDLSGAGYRFMGGRVVPTAHGPAVMFMFDDDHGTRLVLLMRPMRAAGTTRMTRHEQDGATGFAWASAGMGYSLTGAKPPAVIHSLADAVRRQLVGSA